MNPPEFIAEQIIVFCQDMRQGSLSLCFTVSPGQVPVPMADHDPRALSGQRDLSNENQAAKHRDIQHDILSSSTNIGQNSVLYRKNRERSVLRKRHQMAHTGRPFIMTQTYTRKLLDPCDGLFSNPGACKSTGSQRNATLGHPKGQTAKGVPQESNEHMCTTSWLWCMRCTITRGARVGSASTRLDRITSHCLYRLSLIACSNQFCSGVSPAL